MSTLRSALDEFAAEDLAGAPDAVLEDDLAELARAAARMEVERARRLAEVERRGTFRRSGALSIISWLVARERSAPRTAAHRVRVARFLRDVPAAAEAMATGEISGCAVTLLASARSSDPEAFGRSEELLLDAARGLPIRHLARAVAHWRAVVASDRDSDARHSARSLHVSPTIDGMVRIDGDLDPETGQSLLTALGSVIDTWARSPGDERTPSQRRADALGDVCRGFLDRSDRPTVAGERPHLVITVDLATLEGRTGEPGHLGRVGPVSGESARRLACDAGITRVITRGRSEPLDVGRTTATVPSALRRAVVIRDGGCRFPGCDRSPDWCDAHHITHWARGGDTTLGNLVLLCRPHHRLVHDSFRVHVADGRILFTDPDDRVLDDRAPPGDASRGVGAIRGAGWSADGEVDANDRAGSLVR